MFHISDLQMKAIARDTFKKLSLGMSLPELQDMQIYVTNTGKVFGTRLGAYRYTAHPGNEASRFEVFTFYDFKREDFMKPLLEAQQGGGQLKIF